jgi:hypothetical protein
MTDGSARVEFFRDFRHEIWQALRRSLDEAGAEWSGAPIRVQHGPFAVHLDVHAEGGGRSAIVVTRLRAAYVNRDGFRFRIKRRTWMTDLATMLGAQDIEVGDEEFDTSFVLQANSREELRRLVKDEAIRGQLLASPVSLLEVRDDEGYFGPQFPGEVDELYMACAGRITAVSEIEAIYELFADILNRLCHIGSAYLDDPKLML